MYSIARSHRVETASLRARSLLNRGATHRRTKGGPPKGKTSDRHGVNDIQQEICAHDGMILDGAEAQKRKREGQREGRERCQAAEARTAHFTKCFSFLSFILLRRAASSSTCAGLFIYLVFTRTKSGALAPSFGSSRSLAFDGGLRRAAERSNDGSNIGR